MKLKVTTNTTLIMTTKELINFALSGVANVIQPMPEGKPDIRIINNGDGGVTIADGGQIEMVFANVTERDI